MLSQHSLTVTENVNSLLTQVQRLTNINKTTVFELIKMAQDSPTHFGAALEQGFLKIFKESQNKVNRKTVSKFQILAESLFRQLLNNFQVPNWQKERSMKSALKLYNDFLELNIDAIGSSLMNIRIMGSRITFLLIKLIPHNIINQVLSIKLQQKLTSAALHLLKLPVSTYRQLGIKISSMIQNLSLPVIKQIQNQLFKIAGLDDNYQTRKIVITNIMITKENISRILIRLRDKNPQITAIIIKKLQSQRFLFNDDNFNLSQTYKLLYDGYANTQSIAKKQCVSYLAMYFNLEEQEQIAKENSISNQNHHMEIQEHHHRHNIYAIRKDNDQRRKIFIQFVKKFKPELLMINPHLYNAFDSLIRDLVEELPGQQIAEYIKNLCQRIKIYSTNLPQLSQQNRQNLCFQFIWLKNCLKSPVRQVAVVFEELCPTGTQLGRLLPYFIQKQQLYGCYQLLQYFQKQTHQIPDQMGRNRMFDSLKLILTNLKFFSPFYGPESLIYKSIEIKQKQIEICGLNKTQISQLSDICLVPTPQQLFTNKNLESYYHTPIISCSLDLIYTIASAMKALRPDHYDIEMKQIMAQWNNPQENTLRKQREIVITNITKLQQSQQNQNLIKTLNQKLQVLENKIQLDRQKTRMVILSISRLNPSSNIQIFMPIIQDHLSQVDQSNGLLLLGLYCFQSLDKVQNFIPLYWNHIYNHKSSISKRALNRNHLLVSLRVITDFGIKFDIIKDISEMDQQDYQKNLSNNDMTPKFNSVVFLQKIYDLLFHYDKEVSSAAIQSLCRLFYHNKLNPRFWNESFIYILLFWFSTDNKGMPSKSIHCVSSLIKFYTETNSNNRVKNLEKNKSRALHLIKIINEKSLKKIQNEQGYTYISFKNK